MKVPKCPKCKGLPASYTEVLLVNLDFDVNEDGLPDMSPGTGSTSNGDPQKVMVTCSKCNHQWTLRGVAAMPDFTK